MNKYLIINPDILYKLYSPYNIVNYYPYNFLYKFNTIETNIFYDILNTLNNNSLLGLYRYITISWNNIYENINSKKYNILEFTKSVTHEKLNILLNNFIKNDPSLSIYIMDTILKYLYPPKLLNNISKH